MDTISKLHKSEQTKLRIMDVYLDLMSEKYWEKISVKEICTNANITRGTFYQYFNDIYDLLEQIEKPLLNSLNSNYQNQKNRSALIDSNINNELRIDVTPPNALIFWFEFCKKNKKKMRILLSNNSDPYFISKLKNILNEQINHMMDNDSMPNDELRPFFSKAFLELHFLAARTWLDSTDNEFLSTDEIINILNTMRVGANYLNRLNYNKNTEDK